MMTLVNLPSTLPDFINIKNNETYKCRLEDLVLGDDNTWQLYHVLYKYNLIEINNIEDIADKWYNIHKKDLPIDIISNIYNTYNKLYKIFKFFKFTEPVELFFINSIIDKLDSNIYTKLCIKLENNNKNKLILKNIVIENNEVYKKIFTPIINELITILNNNIRNMNDYKVSYEHLCDTLSLINYISRNDVMSNDNILSSYEIIINNILSVVQKNNDITPLMITILDEFKSRCNTSTLFDTIKNKFNEFILNIVNDINITDSDISSNVLFSKLIQVFNNINILINIFDIDKNIYENIWGKHDKLPIYINDIINQYINHIYTNSDAKLNINDIFNIIKSFAFSNKIDILLTEYSKNLLSREIPITISYEQDILNIFKQNIFNNHNLATIEVRVSDIEDNFMNNKLIKTINLEFYKNNEKINPEVDINILSLFIKNKVHWGKDVYKSVDKLPNELEIYGKIVDKYIDVKYKNKRNLKFNSNSYIELECDGYTIRTPIDISNLIFELYKNPSEDNKYDTLVNYSLATKENDMYKFVNPTENIYID